LVDKASKAKIELDSHGFVPDPWILISQNSLLIVPSAWEGDGMVVIEALARNIPFLVTDIPEFRRFGFEEKNYCTSIMDFVDRIEEFNHKLFDLEIPSSFQTKIKMSRNPVYISDLWIKFLNSTFNS
jgi:glycosyltransferase involved in cell wall biosynthesis